MIMDNTFISKFGWKLPAVVLLIWIASFAPAVIPGLALNTSYYVDCSAASNGTGTQASPWNNLATVNATTFGAGDSLLFKRGTTCSGSFVFSSSGTAVAPITIDAYGTGALPAIDGTGQNRAVKLVDTSYVTMKNLEIKNSLVWGILLTTDHAAPATNITLQNLIVHHVTGGDYVPMAAKWTGLVVFAPGMVVEPNMTKGSGTYNRNSYFDTVLVDNVQAYDTTMWAGIFVWGVQIDQDHQWRSDCENTSVQSRNITIQNSTVHDTYGEGITQFCSQYGTLQNNIVYRSGMQPAPTTIGTPVGLWWWESEHMVGQFNESYDNHSPANDGGGYDIDYGSTDSTMQYNYGHDNSTYCLAVFGYSGATTGNILRYNICANDGTVHTYQKYNSANGTWTTVIMPGNSEIELCTWGGGSLANTWIYNNTFYITSTGQTAGLITIGDGSCGDNESGGIFRNNLVTSTIPNVLGDAAILNNRARDYNLYYYTLGTFTDPNPEPHGIYNVNPLVNSLGYHDPGRPTTQWTLQTGSPAINAGTDPCTGLSGCTAGGRDFFGNTAPIGAYDIGAYESSGGPLPTSTNTPIPPTATFTNTPGGPTPTNTPTPTRTNTPVPPTPTNTPAGGVNLALGKTATVSSYNSINQDGSHAVDGNISTYWRTNKGSTLPAEWINVDLGASTTISQVVLKWNTYYATAYTIQVSPDNVNWTTVYTKTGGTGGTETINFTAVSARYVKMNSTAWNNSAERCRLNEIEIYQ
jgi:hypothetical protein